ncbi:MAG: hypothetical protein LBD90_04950 [Bifidobacteriaceae bacterium]|jgi:glycosyltransferase involved in cell wall biosynthesis|nr:hypothetical protein [Bifidobacteriaceae bacterium]
MAKTAVVAAAGPVSHDGRALNTARALRGLGYEVTLLWADDNATDMSDAVCGGFRSVGLPVAHHLSDDARQRAAARLRRLEARPAFAIGYQNQAARRTRAAELAARAARQPTDAVPPGLRLAQLVHRLRSRALSYRTDRLAARRLAAIARPGGWRRELAEVADLAGVFTPWLVEFGPAVIHLADFSLLAAGAQAKRRLASRGKAAALVYDARQDLGVWRQSAIYQRAANEAMERELAPQADRLVAAAGELADSMQRRLNLPARPTVVLNAPAALAAAAAGAAVAGLRQAVGLPPGVPLLVYSGVIEPGRDLPAVIAALGLVEDAHLALVAVPRPGTPGPAALQAVAAAAGVASRLHVAAAVAPDQVTAFLASADVGIDARAADAAGQENRLPGKVFDYLGAGLPVALAGNPAERAFVQQTGLGLVFDLASPADIARVLRQVLASRDQFAARAADADLRRRYSWQTQAEALAAVYRSLDHSPEAP